MVGGSTTGGKIVDETVRAIKKVCGLPVILFPSTAAGFSPSANYIFWMMLLNSMNRRFLVGEQVKAALPLSRSGVKPIPMGYIVVSTSGSPTAVEVVGEVDRIAESYVEKAVAYALTAEYYGMGCVYLEAGSGAEKPVPDEMIRAVKNALSIPLIVGGGIRDAETAGKKIKAGADVIVTGTIAEKGDLGTHAEIIREIKAAAEAAKH
jgi:phosphoglycerol geranylgeranyltransferase